MFGVMEWFKRLVARLILWYTTKKARLETVFDFDSKNVHANGALWHEAEIKMEHPSELAHFSDITDTTVFVGMNSSGTSLYCRIDRFDNETALVYILLQLSDGRTFSLPQHKLEIDKSGENAFSSGGLRMICEKPMLRWRIVFNGLLRESGKSTVTHVNFGFFANVLHSSMDFSTFHNNKFLAKQVTKEWQNVSSLYKQLEDIKIHDQSVYISGRVAVNNEEHNLFLWGFKHRSQSQSSSLAQQLGQLFIACENGILLNIYEMLHPAFESRFQFGGVTLPLPQERPISHISNHLMLSSDQCRTEFTINVEHLTLKIKLENDLGRNWCMTQFRDNVYSFPITTKRAFVDGMNAVSLHVGDFRDRIISTSFPQPRIPSYITLKKNCQDQIQNQVMNQVVAFGDSSCLIESLTGGKGSSLAVLTNIAATNNTFSVPCGFVVTTSAYELFSQQNPVQKEIDRLKKLFNASDTSKLAKECETCSNEIAQCTLPDKICQKVKKALGELGMSDWETAKFAVRSSACGEDSEDMSAAGQMQTFLGVKGFENICAAIVKCWASQFSYTAIQYKRRYGVSIETPMAVVVQQMIESDMSGVMFTCDPLNGNPQIISITANYGLGESVVAATSDPDTIRVRRKWADNQTENINFEIESMVVGEKATKIVCLEFGGTLETNIEASSRAVACLSNEQCLQLATLGEYLEQEYGSPRDIEWAFKNDRLYLLQSRPVTTTYKESYQEIKHERDDGIFSEWESLTKANVGEVFGGAMSALSCDMWIRYFFITPKIKKNGMIQKVHRCGNARLRTMIPFFKTFACQIFFSTFMEGQQSTGDDLLSKGRAIAMGGKLDTSLLSRRSNRNKLRYFLPQKWLVFFDNPLKGVSSHIQCLTFSSMANSLTLGLLAHSEGDFNQTVMGDFARLTQNCSNIVSAEIPMMLQNIASLIEAETSVEKFKNMSQKEAYDWITTKSTNTGKQFKLFLERHGHRCIDEFEFINKTWGMEPEKVVEILQRMVGSVKKPTTSKKVDLDEVIESLQTKLNPFKKCILRNILLPWCRKGIAYRERAKSMIAMSTQIQRLAFYTLAEKMYEESLIPDPKLLFELELYEIEDVILRRNTMPKILSRAHMRRRVRKAEHSVIYPEVSAGIPIPVSTDSYAQTDGQKCMKGTPVSPGQTVSRACVINSLSDAHKIQQGDILITYATDIGWSSYFPLLSGIATELGGLISHGAVVAREFGIPCVVGLHGATSLFETGEKVILNGTNGQLCTVASS